MSAPSSPASPIATRHVRRVVLVPTAANPSRGDELVRRYRLARLRQAGREDTAAARHLPPRSG